MGQFISFSHQVSYAMHLQLNVFVSFIMRNEKRVYTQMVCVCVTFGFAACKLKASRLCGQRTFCKQFVTQGKKEHMLAK